MKLRNGIFGVFIAMFLVFFVTGCVEQGSMAQAKASVNSQAKISEEQAKTIATKEVDLNKVGEITDVELETENGVEVYNVEFTKDGFETDVKINVATGAIVVIENDLTDGADDLEDDLGDDDADESEELDNETEAEDLEETATNAEISAVQNKITEEQAKTIALSKVSGTVTDIEIEKVQGVLVYAVEINANGVETDVKINIATGEVVVIET